MALLSIRDLVVQYGPSEPVLRGVSFDVRAGERIALLGPSGTGKTTLFRSINATAPARAGSITLDGVQVVELQGGALRMLRRRVAVVSQRHDLVDPLLVYQNVMAGALGRWSSLRAFRFLVKPTPEEMEEARTALRRVGLEHKLESRTSDLSGGEHQRVAIARALVQHPLLLLADEPVASLDPKLAAQVIELLCKLAAESNVALICSLHQPALAENYFERVIEMEAGRVRRDRPALGSANVEAPVYQATGI